MHFGVISRRSRRILGFQYFKDPSLLLRMTKLGFSNNPEYLLVLLKPIRLLHAEHIIWGDSNEFCFAFRMFKL
mgnify:CR=1 FL=1